MYYRLVCGGWNGAQKIGNFQKNEEFLDRMPNILRKEQVPKHLIIDSIVFLIQVIKASIIMHFDFALSFCVGSNKCKPKLLEFFVK